MVAVVALVAQAAGTPGSVIPGDTLFHADSEQHAFHAVAIATGLDHPWSVEFLPDGSIVVSEYGGRLRIVDGAGLDPRPIEGLPPTTSEGGLRGIVAHPEFERNRLLYFCYAHGTPEANHTRVGRARLEGRQATEAEVIFVADNEAHELAHYGCRLLWTEEGHLLVTLGDRRHRPGESQSLADHVGTILRLNDDGSAAPGNPFASTPGARAEIWAYGLRNVQGADFHPDTGALWVSEHGPLGGDELNVVSGGENFGWPVATFGIDYDGTTITETPLLPWVEAPVVYWYPSVAPSGLAFYRGDRFPRWRGDAFMGTLAGEHLLRLEVHDGRVLRQEPLLEDLGARIRDVRSGPDGFLYALTDGPNARLLRLEPADPERP